MYVGIDRDASCLQLYDIVSSAPVCRAPDSFGARHRVPIQSADMIDQPGLSHPISIVGCHAEGEVGDVIVGGVAPPPGETLWEQSRWIADDQTLRNFVLNEPRGAARGDRGSRWRGCDGSAPRGAGSR